MVLYEHGFNFNQIKQSCIIMLAVAKVTGQKFETEGVL